MMFARVSWLRTAPLVGGLDDIGLGSFSPEEDVRSCWVLSLSKCENRIVTDNQQNANQKHQKNPNRFPMPLPWI